MDAILSILLVATVLIVSGLITHAFARWMYIRCPDCGTLNARRRYQCRQCGRSF